MPPKNIDILKNSTKQIKNKTDAGFEPAIHIFLASRKID